MATDSYRIVVTETGTRVVSQGIQSIGDTADRASTSVDSLKTLLGSLATIAGLSELIKQFVQLSDEFTGMQNKLQSATGSISGASAALNKLLQISNDTRTPLQANVELFQRASMAANDLGASNQQLYTFVEAVSSALATQGGSAQAASGALLQLGQALGSGVVHAQEFNSVMENAYPIAQAAAKGIAAAGGSVGKLRQLINEGAVTSKQFFDAILSQSEALASTLGASTLTVNQAMTKLNNNLIVYVGQVGQSSGVTQALASAVSTLADNLDKVASALTVVASVAVVLAGPAALGAVYRVLQLIMALILRNPFVLLATTIVAAVTAIGEFNTALDDVYKKMGLQVTAANRFMAAWAGALAYVKAAWAEFPEWLASIAIDAVNGAYRAIVQGVNAIGSAMSAVFGAEGRGDPVPVEDIVGKPERFAKAGENAAFAYQAAFNKSIADSATLVGDDDATQGGGGAATKMTEKWKFGFKDIIASLDQEIKLLETDKDKREAMKAVLDAETRLHTKLAAAQKEEITSRVDNIQLLKQQQYLIETVAQQLTNEIAQLQVDTKTRERLVEIQNIEQATGIKLTETQKGLIDARMKQVQSAKVEADILDSLQKPYQDYYDKVEALLSLLADGKITYDDYLEQLRQTKMSIADLDRSMTGGIKSGLLSLEEEFNNLAELTKNGIIDGFHGAEDALAQFVTTGKLQVTDLVNSILTDLARLAIRQSITGPLASALGSVLGAVFTGGGGGAFALNAGSGAGVSTGTALGDTSGLSGFSGMSNIPGRAAGGPTSPGGLYRVAENGPELLQSGNDTYLMMGGDGGNVIPASRSAGVGGGGAVTVIQPIIYNNASDKVRVSSEATTDQNGQPNFKLTIDSLEKEMASRVKSGRGPLNSSIKESFKVQPKVGA